MEPAHDADVLVLSEEDAAWASSPPDGTRAAVALRVASEADLATVARARVAFPRAALLALVAREDFVVGSLRAGAHATAPAAVPLAGLSAAFAPAVARREAEAALVARAVASRDEALWVMSHELRNPLNVVAMTMALLGEAKDLGEEKRLSHFGKIERAVKRMTSLLDDVSDLARLAAGTLRLTCAATPLRPLVEQAVQGASPLAAERGVSVAVDVPAGLVVSVDAARTVRALEAALSSATLAAPRGKGAVVRVVGREAGPLVELSVLGPEGGPPLGRAAAFALMVAARIVEAQGGRAWTESDLSRTGDLHLALPRPKA